MPSFGAGVSSQPERTDQGNFLVSTEISRTQDLVCRGVHTCSRVCARYRGGKAGPAQLPQLQTDLSTAVPGTRLGDPGRRKALQASRHKAPTGALFSAKQVSVKLKNSLQ